MNIFLWGYHGKLNTMIAQTANEDSDITICGGFDVNGNGKSPIFKRVSDINIPIDVIIDCSRPDALNDIVPFAQKHKIPVVIATTGFNEQQERMIEHLAAVVPVFKSANMSVGVNALLDIVAQAARLLTNFDIEIVEAHHNQKVDSPSGTALMLAHSANIKGDKKIVANRTGARQKNEIGIAAIRGGTIVGEHSVHFCGTDETITLSHTALSKKVFAVGALRAAKLLAHKPAGLYNFKNI